MARSLVLFKSGCSLTVSDLVQARATNNDSPAKCSIHNEYISYTSDIYCSRVVGLKLKYFKSSSQIETNVAINQNKGCELNKMLFYTLI